MIEIKLSFDSIGDARPLFELLSNYRRVEPPAPAPVPKTDIDKAFAPINEAFNKVLDEVQEKAKNAQKPATTSAPPPATPSSLTPAESAKADDAFVDAGLVCDPPPTAAITYDDLRRAIFRLVSKSPDAMKSICTEFGLKTFAGTPENVWPKALARVNEEIAKQGA